MNAKSEPSSHLSVMGPGFHVHYEYTVRPIQVCTNLGVHLGSLKLGVRIGFAH